jgi:tellurite resistance protein
MPKRYARTNATPPELVADYLDQRDEDVMQALAAAGAFVALADGRVRAVERDALVEFLDGQRVVPEMSRAEIVDAFDHRVRQFEGGDNIGAVVEALRPLAGLSLSSVVIRTAERVAAADRHVHPNESRAIRLIRQIMASLPTTKLPVARESAGE